MGLRKIELREHSDGKSNKGFFHGFFTHRYWDGDYVVTKPVALVESETGSVKMVAPEMVRFLRPPKEE